MTNTPDMDTLENNSFAKKGLQFINAINEYSRTCSFPPKFMETVLDKLNIRDGYVMDFLEYGDKYDVKSRLYAHKTATKGIYKGDYEKGCRQTRALFDSLFSDGPKMSSDYSIEEYSDDMLIDGYLSKEAERTIPDVQEYLSYPYTKEAIWQLYLLDVAGMCFYKNRTFFFDRKSLLTFEHKEVASFADSDEIIPKVEITGEGTAIVKCCFWSEWHGLCVEEVIAERTDGKITFCRAEDRLKILFPYHSRIRY